MPIQKVEQFYILQLEVMKVFSSFCKSLIYEKLHLDIIYN